MAEIGKKTWGKLRRALPTLPRRRYNIFCGTNSSEEWRQAWRDFRAGNHVELEEIIRQYEDDFARMMGMRYGTSFGSGRMALYAILEALKIGKGDEVIIPAFTCVVVSNAIIYRGARPVYVDIEPRSFNINVDQIDSAITSRTRALYAQHTFGVPCAIDRIKALGSRYGLPVIEDCAHALGTNIGGKPAGSCAQVAFFSTDHSKIINTGVGGMAVTSDYGISKLLKKIQNRAPYLSTDISRKQLKTFLCEFIFFDPRLLWLGNSISILMRKFDGQFYFNDELMINKPTAYPYPCRLSTKQARIGISQLDSLNKNIKHRRSIAAWLENEIGWYNIDAQKLNNYAWLRYSFMVKDRDAFEQRFRHRFDLGVWFTNVVQGRNKDFKAVKYSEGSCQVAERAAKHIVNFPTHPRIPIEIIKEEVTRNRHWMTEQILYCD